MKAMRLNNAQQDSILVAASLPQPQPGDGEVLIRVLAPGVTPTELVWYPTTRSDAGQRESKISEALMSPSLEQYSFEPSQEIYESRISSEKNQQLEIGPYFALL